MKLKIIMVIAGIALVSSSVLIIVNQSPHPRLLKFAPEESELPTAISNYSKTFKLNTNQPLWTTPANARNTTN
jgi:hypothetical protein